MGEIVNLRRARKRRRREREETSPPPIASPMASQNDATRRRTPNATGPIRRSAAHVAMPTTPKHERRATTKPRSAIVKRSLTISGHRTSISIEEAFWRRLKALAAARGRSISAMIAEIDAARDGANLSSAIRVYVLESAAQ